MARFDSGQSLLERESELGRIARHLQDAVATRGSLLLFEGAAGIGKTSLVVAAASRARELGLATFTARGSELERDFAYGVVRQLFEARIVAATPSQRAKLLSGAAARVGALFGVLPARDQAADALLDPSFAIVHGLYWLCANLSRTSPMLLAIDDIHWSDQASLRFLRYLVARLEELPIAVVTGARPAESLDVADLLAGLDQGRATEILAVEPLTEQAVAELVRLRLGTDVEAPFVRACFEATGGVPFLLHELLKSVADEGITPTAAMSVHVASVTPRAVSKSVLSRLGRLSGAAQGLARATAVLGEPHLRLAARLAGIDVQTATVAADDLGAAEILARARPLRFVHPIVQAVVYSNLPAGERARLHGVAAHLLADDGGSAQRVAVHLLATDPSGDGWVVESLREAARTAIASGAPESAATYLRRALAEPPSESILPAVILELAFAGSYAGDPQAAVHLEAAVGLAQTSSAPVPMMLGLARMLMIEGRNREAFAAFVKMRPRLGNADRGSALTLEGAALCGALLDADMAGAAAGRILELRRMSEAGADLPRTVLAMLAIAASSANEPAEEVARLALQALDGAPKLLPEAVDRPPFFYHACIALTMAESYEEALSRFDEVLADARRLGSLPHVLGLSCYRALVHLRVGHIAEAEADARVALESGPRPPGFHAALALAVLLETLAERGEFDAADAADHRYGLADQFPTMIQRGWLLASRGRLRIGQRRPAEALDDLLTAGDLFARLHIANPAAAPWRSDAALAHLMLGARDVARRLAAEEVALAESSRTPRTLGIALRAAGLAEGGTHGIELLRRAVRVLEESGARLEHARAMTDLGSALRRTGKRSESREILRPALDLAHRCGATALTERTRTELVAAGGRPRRLVISGLDALTPSERRVAQLAAAGLSNRDIAQNLFVTARTVEGHLTHAYQKLAITTREQLSASLAASREENATPAAMPLLKTKLARVEADG